MPRDSNGLYVLPAGNPVVAGTVVETSWANPTMSDIGAELTNSLDRQGRGGMLAPFKFLDGTVGAPGMTWTSEPSTGFYRASAGDQRATVAGVPRMRWTGTGVDVWDSVLASWAPLSGASGRNFAALSAENRFTGNPQVIANADAAWQVWQDTVPTYAARFALQGNRGEIGFYADSIGSWSSVFTFNETGTAIPEARQLEWFGPGNVGATRMFQADTQTFNVQNVAGGAVIRFIIGTDERMRVTDAGVRINELGGAWFNADPAMPNGRVTLGTVVPGPVGGTPGTVWLVF